MGVCYYLWRADNRTAYDLGKAYGWGSAFGRGSPMTLAPGDSGLMAELLGEELVTAGFLKPEALAREAEYYRFVMADIAAWSEGQPFEFVDEQDGRIEDRSMEAYDEGDIRDSWITGSGFKAWKERGPKCECAQQSINCHLTDPHCDNCGRWVAKHQYVRSPDGWCADCRRTRQHPIHQQIDIVGGES